MAHRIVQGRQAASTASSGAVASSTTQPTTRIALSTTFTPPASCAQNSLSILPPPGYFIWANEPVPFGNTTVTDCYPSEFLRSYTSVTSGAVGSSIVPAMSPLVCPQNFCVIWAEDDYMACCPSGYSFTPPETKAVDSRPAYGGTCYSPFSVGVTATMVAYDEDGSTRLQPWAAEKTGDNAYAHPIDGFAQGKASIGCVAAASNSTILSFQSISSSAIQNSSAAVTPTGAVAPPAKSNGTSKGTIAGAVIGALAGLALVLGLILFFLRRRRQQRAPKSEVHQIGDDVAGHRYEKEGGVGVAETDAGVAASELAARSDKYAYELNAGDTKDARVTHDAEVMHELPANPSTRA